MRAGGPTRVLWDRWGVPHIQATGDRELFHAFGWAQAKGHLSLLLRLYARARGRSARLPGEGDAAAEADRLVWTLGIPLLARTWLEAQRPAFRNCLEAFAEGINAYAGVNRHRVDPGLLGVLPVTAADVMAHSQNVALFTFATWPAMGLAARVAATGSNAWAIGPSRSASGAPLLLANPHLPWSDKFLFTEAHLAAPGLDVTGVTLVGFPVITIGFNDHVAWTHTTNPILGANLYRVTPDGAGYRLDSRKRSWSVRRHRVSGASHVVRSTVHGPVIASDGKHAYALRVAGLDRVGMLEQWWDMAHATDVASLERSIGGLQLALMNVLAADSQGHILYVDNGFIPVRPRGDWSYWSDVIPGDSSGEIWGDCHAYAELPRVLDPATGWLQNCNDPPWTCTWPPVLRASDYPAYFAPQEAGLRPQRSLALLRDERGLTLERMIELKHDTRSELAARILDDLVAAARSTGRALALQAADVLADWDRKLDADSRGAALFLAWRKEMPPGSRLFATPWSALDPLGTPRGLADPALCAQALEAAAAATREAHGCLDVPWGQAVRLAVGTRDLPANGGPGDLLGVFRSLDVEADAGGRLRVVDGDTWVAAVEMSKPVRARALLSYGNASEPGSPHHGDQLDLFSRKELRLVARTQREIEENLEDREMLP